MILLAIPLALVVAYLALVAAWEFWEWLGTLRFLAELLLAAAVVLCLVD